MLEISKAYLVNNHYHDFRPGVPAEIIGMRHHRPNSDSKPRLCFHVMYDDGQTDLVYIGDKGSGNYIIITEPEYKALKESKNKEANG